jgi:2-methylcitrate dehydratase PrpD
VADPTLAQQLADFAVGARGGVPPEVATSVRQRVLDVLGLCVAATPLPTSAAVAGLVAHQGGVAEATAIGLDARVPASQAAFLNGVLAHSLDFDDTHLPSVLHPSSAVVPAALAAAQAAGASGADVVAAVAVGLEVTVRLGMAGYDRELGNSVFFEHGQHATSICGAMGAAVAAGLVLGLERDRLVDVLGVTGSMASGIIEANRTGGTVKRVHNGWAARSGVTAAELVQRGLTGPPSVLEGRFGFFEAFLHGSEVDLDAVTAGLGSMGSGTDWSVPGIFFKPYPANHFTHGVVDAGLALRAQGLLPDQVERVEVRVPAAVIRTIGEPIEVKRAPVTGYQAQFSGPYAFAAGLCSSGAGLGVGLADYTDELAGDPVRRRLMAVTDVVPDARCDEIFPSQFPAVVVVRTTDGRVLTEEVLANRGGPGNPLSDDELATKFAVNVAGLVADGVAHEVASAALRLDDLPAVDPLLDPLRHLVRH